MAAPRKLSASSDVEDMRGKLSELLDTRDSTGEAVGNAGHGVYAFYDYEGEPIYVGQTRESLRSRVGRHLTNQRTDAVATGVLDPIEVAEVELWPLHGMETHDDPNADDSDTLNRAEFAVLRRAIRASSFGAVLNEGEIAPTDEYELGESIRGRIVSDDAFARNVHPDVRIARRASTIASLARVISQREVSAGLRRTLVTQARRLEGLARRRLLELDVNYDEWLEGLKRQSEPDA